MKRMTLRAVLLLTALAGATSSAHAAMGGPGFHSTLAPLGVRHWFSENVGGDFGLGYSTDKTEVGPGEATTTEMRIDLGLPICFAKYDKVHFLGRPGFAWFSSTDEATGSPDVETTGWAASAELEVEYWMTDKLTISASHGIAFGSSENDETPVVKTSGFTTTGANFTSLGFHLYLW